MYFFDGFFVGSDMGCGEETSSSLSELSEDTVIKLALYIVWIEIQHTFSPRLPLLMPLWLCIGLRSHLVMLVARKEERKRETGGKS